jgi:hypothetical protein
MSTRSPRLFTRVACLAAVTCLFLTGCDYEVPLSAKPTRPTEEALIGNWLSPDAWMMVRRFNADHYVVFHNGTMYRAWHSDVGGRSFVSVQSLDADSPKYAYMAYDLGSDGKRLDLRFVTEKAVPKSIQDSNTMQEIIKREIANPELLSDAVPYTRMK